MMVFERDIEPYIRRFEEILGLSFKVFIVTAVIVTALGIYVANLLFGNHSLEVLNELKRNKQHLNVEIEALKQENARLHKLYLEWTDAN
jgi:cell division protein FtsB